MNPGFFLAVPQNGGRLTPRRATATHGCAAPAYLRLLPPETRPLLDVHEFLALLAKRLCMLKRGGIPDVSRAAVWFIKWWREEGGLASASAPALPDSTVTSGLESFRRGWGFDLEWDVDAAAAGRYDEAAIQAKMEHCIDAFEQSALEEVEDGSAVSSTQEKKRLKEEQRVRQRARTRARLAAKRGG